MLRDGGANGLSVDSPSICNGRNGGYQIVNIALLAGGNPIVLVGYDMQHYGGKDHFPGGEHPVRTPAENLATYARNFRSMVEPLNKIGVRVLNATENSRIDAFPFVKLEDALRVKPVRCIEGWQIRERGGVAEALGPGGWSPIP